MAKKFYSRKSIRLPGFDYGQSGFYLVTSKRIPWLARLSGQELRLTKAGLIVESELKLTEELRTHVSLISYAVMPEHVHVIFRFGENELPNSGNSLSRFKFDEAVEFKSPINNLGSTIKQLKGACTRHIRHIAPDFNWVRNYWERVIRNQVELEFYIRYINENPKKLFEELRKERRE